jgi:AAA domain
MSNTDQIQAVNGFAGTGKTTELEGMKVGWEAEGYTVRENNVFVEEKDPQKRLDYITEEGCQKYREAAQERKPGETVRQHEARQRIRSPGRIGTKSKCQAISDGFSPGSP